MNTGTQLIFVVLIAILGFFAPQIVTVILLALIYMTLENRAKT